MNKKLNEAIDAVERADALLYAIESCYLTFDILPDEMERANRGVQTLYALWDAVQAASLQIKSQAQNEERSQIKKGNTTAASTQGELTVGMTGGLFFG